jgi:hypothetical protein
MIRRSHTAVVERNAEWSGEFTTEPYEAAWASEALFFVRALRPARSEVAARVQISPDGMVWSDEGTRVSITGGAQSYARVRHFRGWLRLAGRMPAGETAAVTVYLVLKE